MHLWERMDPAAKIEFGTGRPRSRSTGAKEREFPAQASGSEDRPDESSTRPESGMWVSRRSRPSLIPGRHNGPERSRARRFLARRSELWSARTVVLLGPQRRRAVEAGNPHSRW